MNLDIEDRKQLITLLQDLPELANERSRFQILELAGLKQLASKIDLSGSPFMAVSQIVSYLSNYGRLTYDSEALGLLINTLKGLVGVQQQQFLDELLIKYDLMTPMAKPPAIHNWKGSETTADILEKIIGENTLRPIAFLQRGFEVGKSVAYVGVKSGGKRWSGTGFLVAENLLLTNNHVLPNSHLLVNSLFRFNYQDNFQGKAQPIQEYGAKSGGLFHTNETLDYTLVELEGQPGLKWG